MQKLHSLQLEAPITKVITLLSNAITETTNPETAGQIDKVQINLFSFVFDRLRELDFFQAIEILKTTELYVPHLRDDKIYTDPVATDLVGALLSVIVLFSFFFIHRSPYSMWF